MKTIIALAAVVLLALATMMPAVVYSDMLLPPDKPTYEYKGPLNDYFIATHRPDGSCETFEVFAPSLETAIKNVKTERCDFCALDDMTSYFTSGSKDVISQASKTCPLR